VTTLGLGLGYNEDLMSGLASASSGNHIFVEEEEDLIAVFNDEFNDLMSVVAGDFKIHVRVGDGVRPVRVLGTKADIIGPDIYIPLAQLYAGQQRYFVMEVEVDANQADTSRRLVSVDVEYQNMIAETTDKLSKKASVRFSDSVATISEDRDHETYAYCAVQIANERNIRATALRDAGQIEEAKGLLNLNVKELNQIARECKENDVDHVIPELEININVNRTQVELVEGKDWNRNRKSMRAQQAGTKAQQTKTSLLESLLGRGTKSSK
jgi:Ca-activated chloride channel family protein